jgi:hypothetical protein
LHGCLSIEADDPDNSSADDMALTSSTVNGSAVLAGILSPGTYRVLVRGNGETAYELKVTHKPAVITKDEFELNDSFEQAKLIRFESYKSPSEVMRLSWGPGSFAATLHKTWSYLLSKSVVNSDFFELEVPPGSVFRIPTFDIYKSDLPLDITLYDAS